MNTTLVLGGTGKTGRRVAWRLQDRGMAVRIGSRSGEPPFDRENPAPRVQETEAFYPDLATPGAADAGGAFADMAVASGARRLVLLSGRGGQESQAAEERVRASGADLTVVRSSWFAQNFSEDHLLDMVRGGEVALPAGDVPEPVEDIADVAVAARQELPGDVVEFLAYLFTTVLDGRNAHPTDGVQRAIGRPPTDFADHARRTAATGVWNGA
ncbi:SDR family oxidoreductase [Actinomadura rugatobispora]|uniref:SDR family oxidoreductase n=1 Tax=Actinomadura rugatobispora TaxID=1994 RepID=A0ABW1A030_9ACTN|nr:NAD(P)H-binding protein [Actinomadura rugatobispora]